MSRNAFPKIERDMNAAEEQKEQQKREHISIREQAIDRAAVHDFSTAMEIKMNKSREKGKGGWHDPYQCTVSSLAKLMREHLDKGDYVDVGNFAMMLWHRTGKPHP